MIGHEWTSEDEEQSSARTFKQWMKQILLGHTKIESTVRYLDVDIEDALALAEGTEI